MLGKCPLPRPPPLVLEPLISWQRGCGMSVDTKFFIATGSCTTPGPPLSDLPPQLLLPVPRDLYRSSLALPVYLCPRLQLFCQVWGGKPAALFWEGPWVGEGECPWETLG